MYSGSPGCGAIKGKKLPEMVHKTGPVVVQVRGKESQSKAELGLGISRQRER
jgi:hypothetical protein